MPSKCWRGGGEGGEVDMRKKELKLKLSQVETTAAAHKTTRQRLNEVRDALRMMLRDDDDLEKTVKIMRR